MRLLSTLLLLLMAGACVDAPERRVLVANRDLQAGQRLTATDWIGRPLHAGEGGGWVAEDDLAMVQGRSLRVDLPEGSPVTWGLLDPGTGQAPVDSRVPRGLSAMSLWVRGASWVKPRDFVDVLISFYSARRGERVSHLLLQDVPVLEVGPKARQLLEPAVAGPNARPESIEERRLSLLLQPAEALLLCLAYGLGPVHVALRHPDDRGLADPADRITVERLLEQGKKPPPPTEIPGLGPVQTLDP